MNRQEFDALIGRENSYDFWRAEAQHHVATLHLAVDAPIAALEIICRAFGVEWLDENIAARIRGKSLPLSGIDLHPVPGWIDMPNIQSVASTVELGAYLRTFEACPGIPSVQEMLRAPRQFERARTQLAFASRFMRAGATNLELEPDTANGRKADIVFTAYGFRYVVECYAPENPHKLWYKDVCDHSMRKISEWSRETQHTPAIFIVLKQRAGFSAAVRKALEKDCQDGLRRLTRAARIRLERDFYDLEIVETSAMSRDREVTVVDEVAANRGVCFVASLDTRVGVTERIPDVMRNDATQNMRDADGRTLLSRVHLAVPDFDPIDDEAERLAKSVEQKVAQVRTADAHARGLLVVELPLSLAKRTEVREQCARLSSKVLRNHPQVAGILLVERRVYEHRTRYVAIMVGGMDDATQRLWNGMRSLEASTSLSELWTWSEAAGA